MSDAAVFDGSLAHFGHLESEAQVVFLLLLLRYGAEACAEHVEVGRLDDLRVALRVLQGDGLALLSLVVEIGQRDLLARPFLGEQFLQFGHLRDFLAVGLDDNVALDDAGCRGRAAFDHLGHVDAFVRSEVNRLVVFLLCVDVVQHVASLDAQHSTLHGAVLLEVVHHLVHDGGWNGKAVAAV